MEHLLFQYLKDVYISAVITVPVEHLSSKYPSMHEQTPFESQTFAPSMVLVRTQAQSMVAKINQTDKWLCFA